MMVTILAIIKYAANAVAQGAIYGAATHLLQKGKKKVEEKQKSRKKDK